MKIYVNCCVNVVIILLIYCVNENKCSVDGTLLMQAKILFVTSGGYILSALN